MYARQRVQLTRTNGLALLLSRGDLALFAHRSDEFWVMSDELHTLLGLFTHIHIPGLLTGLSFFSALLF